MIGRRVLSAALVGALLLAACKRGGGDDTQSSSSGGVDAGGFDKSALLRAFGQCAESTFREVETSAVELDASVARAVTEGTPAARDAARESWKKTIDAWQRAELFGFGPTALTGSPGGKDLRDPIYAWPLVNRCLIEQQLFDKVYEKPELGTALVNTRGLGAVEYLLFYEGADNACPPTATLNSGGGWTALGAAEIGKRKVAYARALTADTLTRSHDVVAAWDPARGNFVATLASAGPGQVFVSQQMAFNAVSSAFFYVDDFVKNMKLGKPAGFNVGSCAAPPCLADVESQWAHRSKEHLKNNLIGFDRLLRGCGADGAGLGWDDLLTAVGDGALAKKLVDALAVSRGLLDALKQPTLEEDLMKDPAGVKALYDSLRVIVVLLKTEFISVLDLELPKRVEGDND
jgi:predicted lipoprotein